MYHDKYNEEKLPTYASLYLILNFKLKGLKSKDHLFYDERLPKSNSKYN